MNTFITSYFDKLPKDLQKYIYSLIIFSQDKYIIQDIKTFYVVKKSIFSKYSNTQEYVDNNDYYNDFNIHSSIDNDIMRFFNDDNVDNYIKINEERMNRMLSYTIKYKLYGYKANFNFHMNKKTSPKTHINRYIGCLNVGERVELLKYLNVSCILDN